MQRLEPRDRPVWLITGCSSGFGLAIAEAVLRRGDVVVATARRRSALDDLVEAWPERVLALELDVTDAERCAAVVAEATQRLGRIDVLVNNAGRVQIGAVEEVTDAERRALFDVHVFGPANLVTAVLPQMRERRDGTIVQISTMGSFFISTGFSTYTASKAAFEGLSATLAMEVAPFGIRVLIVEPGGHRTAVFSDARAGMSAPMPAYAEIVGPTREFVAGLDGKQDGDPVRAAEILVAVACDPDPPLRLPLGADAFETITEAVADIKREMHTWEQVARSTAFGAEPVPRPSAPPPTT